MERCEEYTPSDAWYTSSLIDTKYDNHRNFQDALKLNFLTLPLRIPKPFVGPNSSLSSSFSRNSRFCRSRLPRTAY